MLGEKKGRHIDKASIRPLTSHALVPSSQTYVFHQELTNDMTMLLTVEAMTRNPHSYHIVSQSLCTISGLLYAPVFRSACSRGWAANRFYRYATGLPIIPVTVCI